MEMVDVMSGSLGGIVKSLPRWGRLSALVAAGCIVAGTAIAQDEVEVEVLVLPFAEITIPSGALLYLSVPPAGSTIPSNGVTFTVTGNSFATLRAEPDTFIQVPSVDYPAGEYMGRAILGSGEVGYRVRLDFPSATVVGSPIQNAVLPGLYAGPTEPPLTVNMNTTGGIRNGRVHLEASHEWTPDGGLPLPGLYVGQVILTVTAN